MFNLLSLSFKEINTLLLLSVNQKYVLCDPVAIHLYLLHNRSFYRARKVERFSLELLLCKLPHDFCLNLLHNFKVINLSNQPKQNFLYPKHCYHELWSSFDFFSGGRWRTLRTWHWTRPFLASFASSEPVYYHQIILEMWLVLLDTISNAFSKHSTKSFHVVELNERIF